jgi:hypothetical protein
MQYYHMQLKNKRINLQTCVKLMLSSYKNSSQTAHLLYI